MTDINSLSHTKWNCKYHIVFCPKYRRQEIYGKIKEDVGKILRKLCEAKGVEIIEAEACPDHIHMLVSIPPPFERSTIYGVPQREEFVNDIRQTCKLKIQVRKSAFLVSWVLCGYGRQERKENSGICKESVAGRYSSRPTEFERIHRPVYG